VQVVVTRDENIGKNQKSKKNLDVSPDLPEHSGFEYNAMQRLNPLLQN
jgi:hypothetical protein